MQTFRSVLNIILKVVSFIVMSVYFCFHANADSNWKKYEVKEKETISEILQSHSFRPIYGKKGALKKTLEINPELENSGNDVYVGQMIYLPMRDLPEVGKVIENSVSNHNPKIERNISSSSEKVDISEDASIEISLGAGNRYFRINAIDSLSKSKAGILSKASPFIGIGMKVKIDQGNSLEFDSQIEKYSLVKMNNQRIITNDSGKRFHFGTRFLHQFSSRIKLGLGVRFDEDLFISAQNSKEIIMDSVLIVKPLALFRFEVFQKRNLDLGLHGEYAYALSSEASSSLIKPGSHILGGTHLIYRSVSENKKSIELDIDYTSSDQRTSILSERKVKDLLFSVNYNWGLKW